MPARNLITRCVRKACHIVERLPPKLRLGTVLPLSMTMRLYGGSDKWEHGYVPHYEEHFDGMRWRVRRVLEIGVGGYDWNNGGGSLRVWRDYFPRATIVGLDIHPKVLDLGRRVRFVQGNQSDPLVLGRAVDVLAGPPDIVIDDGSHFAGHAEAAFDYLFPLMPSGGWFVIEDLHTAYWKEFGGAVPAPENAATRLIERLVDSVQRADPSAQRWGLPYPDGRDDVASVDVRPGIAFIGRR